MLLRLAVRSTKDSSSPLQACLIPTRKGRSTSSMACVSLISCSASTLSLVVDARWRFLVDRDLEAASSSAFLAARIPSNCSASRASRALASSKDSLKWVFMLFITPMAAPYDGSSIPCRSAAPFFLRASGAPATRRWTVAITCVAVKDRFSNASRPSSRESREVLWNSSSFWKASSALLRSAAAVSRDVWDCSTSLEWDSISLWY
mmetsp:Transcript_31628/g.69291  ORF Transcript_31628/g.69291 Transcript_31628/m.69291 type:complete len:205 (+) Transcript_31628:1017-1631(+)